MNKRFRVAALIMVVAGLVFVGTGGYTFIRTQAGASSLQSFSSAQAVKLSYNDADKLVDRGDPEEAAKIMSLLKNDWGYPVDPAELDPNDPPGEYQFAVAGRYWSQFDRQDPIQGKAREQAWTGTAQALIGELGVGSVTATTIQMGYGIAAIAGLLGLTFIALGGASFWAIRRPATLLPGQ